MAEVLDESWQSLICHGEFWIEDDVKSLASSFSERRLTSRRDFAECFGADVAVEWSTVVRDVSVVDFSKAAESIFGLRVREIVEAVAWQWVSNFWGRKRFHSQGCLAYEPLKLAKRRGEGKIDMMSFEMDW